MQTLSGNTNIVNCHDVLDIAHENDPGWDIYIRMELLTPLLRHLGNASIVPDEQVIRIGRDLCNALVLCEKRRIIHRDIKPQNIFVSEVGDYKLGDFGIARIKEGTETGTMRIGTYDYMAPEVYSGSKYNHTVDIYSLGLVLYWLLNERRGPFLDLSVPPTDAERSSARSRRMSGEPLPPPAHGSTALQSILLKACAFLPQDRYQGAEELLSDLVLLGAGARFTPDHGDEHTVGFFHGAPPIHQDTEVIHSPAVNPTPPAAPAKPSVSPWRVPVITSVCILVVGITAFLILRGKSDDSAEEESPAPVVESIIPTEALILTSTPEPTPEPTPTPTPEVIRPGPDDLLGADSRIIEPDEYAWLDAYETKYVASGGGYGIYLRYGPSLDYQKFDTILDGTSVTVLAEQNGYSLVIAPGRKIGWCRADSLF